MKEKEPRNVIEKDCPEIQKKNLEIHFHETLVHRSWRWMHLRVGMWSNLTALYAVKKRRSQLESVPEIWQLGDTWNFLRIFSTWLVELGAIRTSVSRKTNGNRNVKYKEENPVFRILAVKEKDFVAIVHYRYLKVR